MGKDINEVTKPTIDPNAAQDAPAPAESEPVVDDKKTNRTFSQSEHDAEIARVQKETEAKYNDYTAIKTQNDELVAAQKKRELDEMSETEQAQKEAKELTQKLQAAETKNTELALNQLKADILIKPEYQALPRAYRSMVTGTDEESITVSIDKILEEYKADTKGASNTPDFGPSSTTKDKSTKPSTAKLSVRDIIAAAGERVGILPPKDKQIKLT